MDRDALVETVADALFRSFNPWMSTGLANEPPGVREMYRGHALAALAVAEPVIQADERERCATDKEDGWEKL